MVKLEHVLVPVDFSECSEAALQLAAELAERFGATLDVVHILELPLYIFPEVVVRTPAGPQSMEEYSRVEAGKELDALLTRRGLIGKTFIHPLLQVGYPRETILELADKKPYDLIVMGTHGRRGLSHLVAGSVAEQVVRRAHCPVLTVRHPDSKRKATKAA